MSNITFDMPIDRTVTVITDGRNITNIVFDMNIPDRPDLICEKAKEQFLAYFDGGLKEFSLPYDISGIGTPFFRSILTAVQKIPYGERVTYMQAAEMAGSKAVRACGSALKRNPLPKKLVPVIVSLSGIPMDTKVNSVTREQRAKLVYLLKHFTVTVTDFRPIEEAVVTSGGVKTSELDPKTMQSKLIDGLYFAGEVIDADAYTGGFNLQIAFSTGHLAGESAAQ